MTVTTSQAEKQPLTMTSKMSRCRIVMRENMLMLLNIAGIIIGLVLGFGIREVNPSEDALMWIGFPGELFLRMLRLLILPLIVCSVISGSAAMDPKSNGKIGLVAMAWIFVTHVIACSIGVVLAMVIEPGVGSIKVDEETINSNLMQTQDIFADLFRNLVPNNMIEAAFIQAKTQYGKVTEHVIKNGTNGSYIEAIVTISKSNGSTGGVNVIGIITISSVFGIAVSKIKTKAIVFLQFFDGATELILLILRSLFWIAPVGIASLIAVSIAPVEDIAGVFSRLGLFVVCVVVGLLIHQFTVLPTLYYILTRRNPFKFMLTIIRAQLLAFASGSTAVAIPEMLVACDTNGIDSRVSRFIVPFCTAVNADGSVVFVTCATIFIIQLTVGTVTGSQAVITLILTSVCGLAIPSVPSASIVTLIIILTSLNIPITQVSLLFAVEWFLDRLRTQTNVSSHTMCAAITYHLCRKNLKPDDDDLTDVEMEVMVNGDKITPKDNNKLFNI